jgi:Ser/Thr protein kinase RdoA (MazF antagonist)
MTGRQLFNEWRGKMHPKEDRSKTFPAFLELAQTLVEIIPHMYTLFPVPESACRPALAHPDFHFSNILVSKQDPTIITGVVDWELASILPLWAAYTVPHSLKDWGDKYEVKPEWRAHKARLRVVFAQAVVQACPDASVVAQPGGRQTEQSLCALRLLSHVATSGVALYAPFEEVRVDLASIRVCVAVDGGPIVEKLDRLVTLFSQSG